MRILGIDPGVATIGFGVVNAEGTRLRMESYGTITTPAGLPLATRLLQIETDMEQLLRDVKPDEVSIEELFFSKNITTGIAVAHGRGVILCTIEKMQLPVYEYTPMQVKQAITGYGKAVKKQIQEMTRMMLHLETIPKPDDTADALGMAIAHCHCSRSRLMGTPVR